MSEDLKAAARRWAWEYMLCNAELPEYAQDDEYRAAQHILATTTPLTMADVEWNDEKHHLAGAVFEAEGSTCPVVMIGETLDSLGIYSVDLDENTGFWPSQEDLTPNGKKYELREVGAPAEPEHPVTLETQADYENAPEGTVVAEPRWQAWQKRASGKWVYAESKRDSGSISGTKRQVLRWGWGK